MEINREFIFEEATAKAVFAALSDPAFEEARMLRTGATRVERVEDRTEENRRKFRLRVTRRRAARPGVRASDEVIYHESVSDQDRMRVSWRMTMPEHGDRVELMGDLVCQSVEPGGCLVQEMIVIEVHLTQIGRSVEHAIAHDIRTNAARDEQFIRDWLSTRSLC